MNKTTTIILVLIMASLVYFSAGCKKDDGPDTVEYQMQVDTVTHTDTITVGELFEITFYGPIGPNDCYSFSRFVPEFGLQSMSFTLYGIQEKRDDCAGSPKYMNGGTIGIEELTAGEWNIIVNEPEGITPLNSTLYVKE